MLASSKKGRSHEAFASNEETPLKMDQAHRSQMDDLRGRRATSGASLAAEAETSQSYLLRGVAGSPEQDRPSRNDGLEEFLISSMNSTSSIEYIAERIHSRRQNRITVTPKVYQAFLDSCRSRAIETSDNHTRIRTSELEKVRFECFKKGRFRNFRMS